MSPTAHPEAVQAARRAVARIRSNGIDGPRPLAELEALRAHEEHLDDALRSLLRDAAADDLAAVIHLVQLLRRDAVLDDVREVAFTTPADWAAKREALETLRDCNVHPDEEVVEKMAAVEAIARGPDAESLAALLDWPAAWRGPALEVWLGAAGEDQLEAVEIALGIQPELDARLLDWIAAQASEKAARVLQRFLAQGGDKARIKQVKRALHRLRARGVAVDDPGSDPGGGFSLAIEGEALQDARAYLTSVDGSGARMVWVLWRVASGGSRLLQAVVDDDGIRDAEIATVTRQGFREYVEQMHENPAVLLQQVPLEDAAAVLGAAAARTEESEGELPPDYRKWAELAGVAARATGEPAIYRHLRADEVRGDEALLDESMTLLREPHFQSWALAGTAIDDAAEEIHQAETSTLMANDEQRQERMQDAIKRAVTSAFDDGTRHRYRERLETMAAMLWERGERDKARQALAAAVTFTEADDLFHKHAFARALAHRGVWLAYQDKQRERQAEEQRSRIVRP